MNSNTMLSYLERPRAIQEVLNKVNASIYHDVDHGIHCVRVPHAVVENGNQCHALMAQGNSVKEALWCLVGKMAHKTIRFRYGRPSETPFTCRGVYFDAACPPVLIPWLEKTIVPSLPTPGS